MRTVNLLQKAYYEYAPEVEAFTYRGNAVGRAWARLRSGYGDIVNSLGEFEMWSALHWAWMGDLSDKKVLDLGCHAGNQLSLDLARRARRYVGLDLSESATAELQRRIDAAGIEGAYTVAADFLSDEFDERDFDVVYAQSVFHHFRYVEPFLERVGEVLAPGGQVITSDPMSTYWPLRLIRAAYRPFQRDRAWEYPFTRATFATFQRYFDIEHVQGMMGRSKWILLVYPLSKRYGERKWREWFAADQARANCLGPDLWKCMRVTMSLRKRAPR